jgi:ketol-acid reductoisomerase
MKKYLFILLSCAVLPLAACAQPVSTSADIGAAVYDPHGSKNNQANQIMNNALQNAQNSAQAGQAMQDAMNKAAQSHRRCQCLVNAAAPTAGKQLFESVAGLSNCRRPDERCQA